MPAGRAMWCWYPELAALRDSRPAPAVRIPRPAESAMRLTRRRPRPVRLAQPPGRCQPPPALQQLRSARPLRRLGPRQVRPRPLRPPLWSSSAEEQRPSPVEVRESLPRHRSREPQAVRAPARATLPPPPPTAAEAQEQPARATPQGAEPGRVPVVARRASPRSHTRPPEDRQQREHLSPARAG